MPVRDLPIQPSLRHLKQEAKQFHKQLQDGDTTSIERIRAGLPRLSADDAVDDVTLMEAQHVLSREYGFREWPALVAAAELELADLAALSDEDTQRLLRETDQKDLVTALIRADDDVKDRMLSVMSERVRKFISEEMEFKAQMPEEESRDAQRRMLAQVRMLGRDGTIGWPPGAQTPPAVPPTEPDLEPEIAAHIKSLLKDLSLDQIRELVHGLAARARAHGIPSLETAARSARDGFVQEAIRLAVDGTEPDLIEDLMKTRIRALLLHLENRQLVIHEGTVAICGGDNPRLVAHKLVAVYSTDYGVGIEPSGASLEALQDHVRQNPVASMDPSALAQLLTDISEQCRRHGKTTLAPLVAVLDDELLREGVRMLAESVDMKTICQLQEPRMREAMGDLRSRLGAFTAGVKAVQLAKKGADLDRALAEGAA